MTRIVGGTWGGRLLETPRGQRTRPTSERVRAALANALTAAGGLAGARVLDLYAGSGALGLELLSRGADSLVLVERDPAAVAAARANIAALGVTTARLVVGDVAVVVAGQLRDQFDIVLADPPYELADQDLTGVFEALHTIAALAPGADLIVERGRRSGQLRWPVPLVEVRTRRYGDTVLCYGRAP